MRPALIIGTPVAWRIIFSEKSFDARTVAAGVLDEFDKNPCRWAFNEQLMVIFKGLTGKQQHILTSATRLNQWPEFLPLQTGNAQLTLKR